MKFTGDILIEAPRDAVYAKVRDARFFASCIEGVQDLNEIDPTDTGTMGTIPGAIIECNVGDTLQIHFRNLDTRTKNIPAPWEPAGSGELLPAAARAHSLHAHGLTFPSKYDGAYPLSPPDPGQLITTPERNQWIAIGVTGSYKQGDRVPITVKRDRRTIQATLVLGPPERFEYRIEEKKDATPQQKAMRSAWLNGL